MPLRSSRRTYNRVQTATEDAVDDGSDNNVGNNNNTDNEQSASASIALAEPLSPSLSSSSDENENNTSSLESKLACNDNDDDDNNNLDTQSPLLPSIYHQINITLLDTTQKKFTIKCDAKWKVSEFKMAAKQITKVPPESQRLIHMGKLLQDNATLEDCGIKEDGLIIHLFPKPNVVISSSSTSINDGQTSVNNNDDDDDDENENNGAHIPQIILDEDEAQRRSQILILSSQEIFEAQHRVKIFSFLLMIISSMELLTLMTLFMGVSDTENSPYSGGDTSTLPPGNPTDTPPSSGSSGGSGGNGMQVRVWQNSDYFDTIISAFGFYVSLLGIKATTENTLQLAKRYFICIILAGIGSNCYYFYLNVQATAKHADERNQHLPQSELYTSAFVGILLPLTIWLLCIIRAYQFQILIREAEIEAEERARGLNNGRDETNGSNNHDEAESGTSNNNMALSYGSDDLELAVERGVST